MLKQLLEDYLANVKEREFDLPFLSLLHAMGFFDVHYTHGAVEFGKDFIAKKQVNGQVIQYSFQSKQGDINLSAWRKDIQPQMMEAILTDLSHPNFDTTISHQSVLVLTGDLRNQASIEAQALNRRIQEKYGERPIEFWSSSNLVDHLLKHGLEGIHGTTASDFADYGLYFVIYGRARQGTITSRMLEEYSRVWKDAEADSNRRLLWFVIEAEILSNACLRGGRLFEAITVQLCLIRALCAATYVRQDEHLTLLYRKVLSGLNELSQMYVDSIVIRWSEEKDLTRIGLPSMSFSEYPIQCARTMTCTALAYFSTDDPSARQQLSEFLGDFISKEVGTCHPISDEYAISLALSTLTLIHSGNREPLTKMLTRSAIWICDRYQLGAGLAGIGADEVEELVTLLGYCFDFFDVQERNDSLVATLLCDLAALQGDGQLYSDILNDFEACNVFRSYFQPPNTIGSCYIEANDVLQVPSVQFSDPLTQFSDFDYSDHVRTESRQFGFTDQFGAEAIIPLMALLHDRYFPTIWPSLLEHDPSAAT